MTGGGENDELELEGKEKGKNRMSVVMFQDVNHRLGLV